MRITDMHPLIAGLVRELPEPGMAMAETRHQDWLDCAAHILALLYPEPSVSTAPASLPASAPSVQAKHVAEASSEPEDAGGVQDRCESTPPPNSAASHNGGAPAPRGAADGGEVEPDLAVIQSPETASSSQPQADSGTRAVETDPVKAGNRGGENVAGHDRIQIGTASPALGGEGRGADSEALGSDVEPVALNPAPSLASRLRKLNSEHPEYTVAQAATALDVPLDKARNNSNVNKIRWKSILPANERERGLENRVVETHRDHPDWPDTRIGEHLGCSPAYVRVAAKRRSLALPSRRDSQPHVEARSPALAPEPAPTPEGPPAIARAPIATIPSGTGSAIISTPMRRAPKGQRFWLRNEAGLYLHYGCENMTNDRRYAWSGSQDQLLACRRKFPLAADLTERVVEKEQARVTA